MRRFLMMLGFAALSGLTMAQVGPEAMRAIGVDTTWATVPVDEILSGGPPPQGIPALGFTGDHAGAAGASGTPQSVSQEEAATWLGKEEPVIALTVGGESRAYPLQILTWHEIANDTLGGVPIAVTFCPLCSSALAFDRRVPLSAEAQQRVLEVTFGVSGLLYNSNMLMFDTASSTL